MKAIETKYVGPTDTRGAQIIASDMDGVSYPHELSGEEREAAWGVGGGGIAADRDGWSLGAARPALEGEILTREQIRAAEGGAL